MLTMIWTVWNAYGKRLESGHTIWPGIGKVNASSRGRGGAEPFTRRPYEANGKRMSGA